MRFDRTGITVGKLLQFDGRMRSSILIFLMLALSTSVFSQRNEIDLEKREDSLRRLNRQMTISELFWNSDSDQLCYLGISNSFEMKSYCIGGEFKFYGSSYDPLLSGSLYGNFRTTIYHFDDTPDFNAVSFGGHLGIFGAEVIGYFNRNAEYYYFAPKIGYDYGSWSAFYGYNFPISPTEYKGNHGHNLSLKYHLYLSAFTYHKMRRQSYGY